MRRYLESGRRAIVRSAMAASLAVALLAAPLWAFSCLAGPIGGFSFGQDTSLRITRGMAEVHHFYEYNIAPAMPEAQWHPTAIGRGWTAPRSPTRWGLTGIHFTSGHVSGMSGPEAPSIVSPARYWLLRIPLWPMVLPGLVVGTSMIVRWSRRRRGLPRGFPVDGVPLAQRG